MTCTSLYPYHAYIVVVQYLHLVCDVGVGFGDRHLARAERGGTETASKTTNNIQVDLALGCRGKGGKGWSLLYATDAGIVVGVLAYTSGKVYRVVFAAAAALPLGCAGYYVACRHSSTRVIFSFSPPRKTKIKMFVDEAIIV